MKNLLLIVISITFGFGVEAQFKKSEKYPLDDLVTSGNSAFLKWNVLEIGSVENGQVYYSPALGLGIGLNFANTVTTEVDGIYNYSIKDKKNHYIALRGSVIGHLTRSFGLGASVTYLPTQITKIDYGYRLRFKIPVLNHKSAIENYYNGATRELYIDLAGAKSNQFLPTSANITLKIPIVTSDNVWSSPGF